MRVEWVHPSWRDLVIGRLQADPGARRDFLSRSGVHGIVLALSTAGGAEGERRLPLIRCDQDWDTLADRLYALIPELEPSELAAVLMALTETIDELGDAPPAGEARALARATLGRIAALWEAARAAIAFLALEAWLALGKRLTPRPAPAALSITWVELLPTCVPELDDRAGLERFADWLALCELLWDYDPGLRGELGFGKGQVRLMVSFQNRVDARRTDRALPPIPAATADQIVRALSSIASLEFELAPYARHIALMLGRDAPAGAQTGSAPEPDPRLHPFEIFDVRRVLSDL